MRRDGAGRKSTPRYFTMRARNWRCGSIRRLSQRGVGAAPVGRATLDCLALGVGLVYLCVRPERSGFYERPGWIPIERDVGERHPSAFIRDAIPETKINRSPP
jgi:hypothetical protein